MYKSALNASIIISLLAVIIGAFGAHSLKESFTDELMYLLESYETAVRYQFYHALALGFIGVLYKYYPSNWLKRATWMFIIGIALFSGSIYLLVGLKATASIGLGGLGIITPIGGTMMILGWLFTLIAINRKQ